MSSSSQHIEKSIMKPILSTIFAAFSIISTTQAQVTLSANGQDDTYSLINNVLAPGATAVETPDCGHVEFGPHIDQVWDEAQDEYVFRFHIHVEPDNDRCKNFDRQRNEIKTYDKSPDNLKATHGEQVVYQWKFKLDKDFQPSSSFTHLHQLKAVGGSEESMPLITFTARKKSTNTLQLRYAKNSDQETIHEVVLSDFLGEWVEVYEEVCYGEDGSYSLKITRMSDSKVLVDFMDDDLRMWKTDAEFIRPKWGIYRSLNQKEDLRDEIILFNKFIIEEKTETYNLKKSTLDPSYLFPNPCMNGEINIESCNRENIEKFKIYSCDGKIQQSYFNKITHTYDVSHLDAGYYIGVIYFNDQTFTSVPLIINN